MNTNRPETFAGGCVRHRGHVHDWIVWVNHHPVMSQIDRAATHTYGITLVLVAVSFNALWLYASVGARLLRADHDPKVVRGITRSYRLGPETYLAATVISIVSPTLGVVLFAAIAALYILESSLFGRTKQSS